MICVRVCSLKEYMCVRLGVKCSSRELWPRQSYPRARDCACVRMSHRLVSAVLCGHGLCVPAADRAGAGAASELVPVPSGRWCSGGMSVHI